MSDRQAAGTSAESTNYNRYFEFERIVSKVTVTAEGNFLEDNVPAEYAGAELEVELVHSVRVINSKSELLIFEFYNEPAMDKDRQKGGPIVRDGVEIVAGVGPSTVPLVQTTRRNPQLQQQQHESGEYSMEVFKSDLKATPNATQWV